MPGADLEPMAQPETLLAADEPAPVVVVRPDGASPLFLTCDHAGRRLPRALGDLGLPEADLRRHIAWDIGVAALSRLLSARLDGTLIEQVYSRLAVDCNRPRHAPDHIATLSETTAIPGNLQLSAAAVAARTREIWQPYHDRIAAALDARKVARRPTVLVAMHSFTPVFKGVARPWHIGVLYGRDPRLGRILLGRLAAEGDLTVGDNQPYRISDATDYGIPVHGEGRGIPHVELEIRQDLIDAESGQFAWAERLARVLTRALHELKATGALSP